MKNIWYILAGIFMAGCSVKGNVQDNKDLPRLPVIEVSLKDTSLHHDYVTSIEAVKNVEIRTRVQGFLNKIFVDEGQVVKKGQSLFQLDDKEFVIALSKAKANVNNAEAEARTAEVELLRVKGLLAKEIVSPTEKDMAEAKYKAAQAKVEEAMAAQKKAETSLSYTFIHSPFDGIINRIPFKAGSVLDAGALLTTISDNHEVYAYFNVSENEYLNYRKTATESRNNNISLLLADGTAYPYSGKIETVEGEFDESTGSIAFRARFPNPSRLLKHGASGKVRLTINAGDALIIPQKAVFEIQDKSYVFVVNADNTVKMTTVVPQARIAQSYIIKEGLNKGDKIVYEGVQRLREGARIQPILIHRQS
jgi:membrane fusion protein (multidrug efflux system)